MQIPIVGFRYRRRGVLDQAPLGGRERCTELGDDLQRDHLLQLEGVLDFAVVSLGPDVLVAAAVDQLQREPQVVADAAHRALEDQRHVERVGDLAQIAIGVAVPCTEVREITRSPPARASAARISSCSPSAK